MKLCCIDRGDLSKCGDCRHMELITAKTQQKSLSDYEDKEDDDMEKVDNGVVEDATDGFVVPDWNLSDIQVWFVP